MLIEKEIIGPGTYWYTDEGTGLPRKLDVTPELTRYWYDQGNKMLGAGLSVPVPYEHDFNAHPMTPKDKLLNNAGEVKEYRLKGDALWSVVDVQDPDVKKKIGHSIRWTSPWINTFTDGQGHEWKNVISHLALTTRPRVTKQVPFSSIAAALSIATETKIDPSLSAGMIGAGGLCLSRAGRLLKRKKTGRVQPQYPMAFSMFSGGAKFAGDEGKDFPPLKDNGEDDLDSGSNDDVDITGLMDPLQDQTGDVAMEELLSDLLNALGVQMPEGVSEAEFKRALYEATMTKIKELTSQGLSSAPGAGAKDSAANTTSPASSNQTNPLIQQEQQPMYMSLEDINKLPEPMKGVALAMYTENQKLRAEMEVNAKTTASLRDGKLKEAAVTRQARVMMLSKLSPRVKADLEGIMALPSMALSLGEGGAVVDPMAQTLAILEKGLADIPRLLTVDASALSIAAQPTDADALSAEQEDKLADDLARRMGCPPEQKKAS